ncbi:MAG TPA: DUF2157 domain-containing protein [Dehalococcoidia bacterium]|nr:DUF2157 domain-containing protein [Dehalococcoidia bacterium]
MTSQRLDRARTDRRFLEHLPEEVQDWQERGIINPDQGRAILDTYDVPDVAQEARGRLVTVLAVLGSILVGLGIILFFASNWQEIHKEVKLALMLVGIPTVYVVGYWLRYHRGYERAGTATILLGALFYGAAIHLVAQPYNIPVNHPNLVLYWFLGVIPLAYVVRSDVMLVLGIGLFLAAIGFRGQVWLLDTDLMPFRAFPLYLVLGLMLYGLGKLQGRFESTRVYSRAYELVGLLTVFAGLYLLSFRFWWEELFDRSVLSNYGVTVEFWLIAGVASAVAVVSLTATMLTRANQGLPLRTLPYEAVAVLVLLVVAALVVFLQPDSDLVYPLLFNFLLLVGMVGLIFLGYFRGREVLINLALVFFSIDVVTRYFEFSFELLDRSVVFIVAGIILLAGGFLLERGRRRVIGQLRTQEAGNES